MTDREKLALVVDSDETSRRQVVNALRAMGCAVEQAVTVREAVAEIGRQRPDVIVCNPVAPDREGFDLVTWLLTWLKADPKTQSIPLFYLLAPDTPPELTSTLRAGPSDYLTGPFNREALQRRIAEKLGQDTPPEPASPQAVQSTRKSRHARKKETSRS
ncbi:MAG TPA: response regulator, partial [Chloroflexota bacterium]|nr:response regulator [Chloroflexota bacterium]